MAKLEASGFDLIVNPVDAEPTRAWVLENIANPDVISVCLMHGQGSDKVDEEFLNACNPNLKTVSTFSVGFGEWFFCAREYGKRRTDGPQTTSTSRVPTPAVSRLATPPVCSPTRWPTLPPCLCS